nr:RNA-directed DNA polymerase, eukaryota, reverse transcriptase zinc-binding domain protein [Tanacetum cinerariifolium]
MIFSSLRPKVNQNPNVVQNVSKGGATIKPNNTTPKDIVLLRRKPSFMSVVHGCSKMQGETSSSTKVRSIALNDYDLITVNDSSKVIMVKLKEVDTMKKIYVDIHGESFEVRVQELEDKGDEGVKGEEGANMCGTNVSSDDIVNCQVHKEDINKSQYTKEEGSSNLSCPLGFEQLKKINNWHPHQVESSNISKCSTSFARYWKKYNKRVSVIHEMSRLIKVGGTLGLDAIVWDCGSDKAFSPDGCSFSFVRRYWELRKFDVHEFVSTFFDTRKMSLRFNSSFITSILKISNPINIKVFLLISLIGIHCKIIAKILAIRLSKAVKKIISHEQSAFISGHQILDGPFMLSEVIDCPTYEFSVKRWLRQGDPLSPFCLFSSWKALT